MNLFRKWLESERALRASRKRERGAREQLLAYLDQVCPTPRSQAHPTGPVPVER